MRGSLGPATAFLHAVLHDTWQAVIALLCASYVDVARARGTCGTEGVLTVPCFLASLGLCAGAIIVTCLRLVGRRSAVTSVSTVVNAYAVIAALLLALPYARV